MFAKRSISRTFSILFILVFMLAQVTPAYAAGLVVNSLLDNTNDDSICTLREAIRNANDNAQTYDDCPAGSGADTITFSVSGTITLGSILPDITDAAGLTIDGTGQTVTISGNHALRVMKVGNYAVLTLNNLMITNGLDYPYDNYGGGGILNFGTLTITNSAFSGNSATDGGGILNAGILTITNSTFSGNSANWGGGIENGDTLTITNSTFSGNSATGGSGGGIINDGTLAITDSTFSGNSANHSGGGIYYTTGTLTITNSAFSDNSASNYGGGIYSGGSALTITNSTFSGNSANVVSGIYNDQGNLTVTNSTFSGNSANANGSIFNSGGTATLRNTIVANNTSGNCSGNTITNGGNNIDDGTTCGWGSANGSMSNTDPNLGPLTDNGGPTQTLALFTGSPAIDAGDDATCAAAPVSGLDQRGVTRPGVGCDIGAFEYEPDAILPTTVSITRVNANPTSAASVKFTVTFSENVTGVDSTDFSPTSTGIASASVASVTPVSATTYTVKVNIGVGKGTVRLDVADDDSIVDRVGNPLGGWGGGNGNFTTGEVYTVNKSLTFNSTGAEDGWILESTETSEVGGSLNANATTFRLGDNAQDKQYRAILSFDTSSLPDNAVITSITLRLRQAGAPVGANPFTSLSALKVDIRKPRFGSLAALEKNDFQAAAGMSDIGAIPNTPVNNWYTRVWSTDTFFSFISKTSLTQFRLRFSKGDNDNGVADYMKFNSGNHATVSVRPTLIIRYYVP